MSVLQLILIFKCFTLIYCADQKYATKLLSLDNCKVPENRMDKDNAIQVNMSSRRINRTVSVITSNFEVAKRIGPISFNFRAYQLQRNSVRDLEYRAENQACKEAMIVAIAKFVKLNIDDECYLLAGTFEADNINVDDISAIFTRNVMTVGKYAYDMEIQTNRGVIACVSMALELTSNKKSKK